MAAVALTPQAAPLLRVAATWGTTIVGMKLLARGQDCALGQMPGALAPMPEGLVAPALPLRASGSGWELDASGVVSGTLMLRGREENLLGLARAGTPVPVLPGDYGLLQYGQFSIFFQYTTAPPPLHGRTRWDPLMGLSIFSSIVFHLGAIGLLIVNWTPPPYHPPPELVPRLRGAVSPEPAARRMERAGARKAGRLGRRQGGEGPRREGHEEAGRRPEDRRQGGQGRHEREGRPHGAARRDQTDDALRRPQRGPGRHGHRHPKDAERDPDRGRRARRPQLEQRGARQRSGHGAARGRLGRRGNGRRRHVRIGHAAERMGRGRGRGLRLRRRAAPEGAGAEASAEGERAAATGAAPARATGRASTACKAERGRA